MTALEKAMIDVYAPLVCKGIYTIEGVPKIIREQVKKEVEKKRESE